MKINITFKTPDAMENALANANVPEEQKDRIYDRLSDWIKYGEYVNIEFDLDANTATVIKTRP